MRNKGYAILAVILLAGIAILGYTVREDIRPLLERWRSDESVWFTPAVFPYKQLTYLYDMGVVDADDDGHLDLYTSNHNYRQVLLLADDRGGFRDVLSDWGLDQNRLIPASEQHRDPPRFDRPGLYLFWQGDVLHLVLHETRGWAPLRGRLQFYNRVEVVGNDGFQMQSTSHTPEGSGIPVTEIVFTAPGPGRLRLYPHTRGTPIKVTLDAPWAKEHVYIGAQKQRVDATTAFEWREDKPHSDSSLGCRWCLSLQLDVRDRHALAWADYNGDGRLDVFINRGALGGTLRKFPQEVRQRISDELLLSERPGQFVDRARELGIEKKDCSGRHARWVDYDRDVRLDLFINCQDRGKVAGGYPKQLYRQGPDGRLADVATEVGLDLPNHQLVDLVWLDVDADGWIDLLTHEDTGFYVYYNRQGRFERVAQGRGPFHRAEVPGLTGETTDYWQFDGKLSVADFDADGDLDAFMASKKGNVLLVNEGGRFRVVSPDRLGLPRESVAAVWVDYDNDGRADLHTVPQGLYRNDRQGRFTPTAMLRQMDKKYQAAIVNWFDRDNDGRIDLLLAMQDNASLWRWWERPFKSADVKGKDDRFDWKLVSLRNIGKTGHWLQIELIGAPGNPQAIGAHVTVTTADGRQAAQVGAHEGAYSSQGHYRLYFGLGAHAHADILIRWPDGVTQKLLQVAADHRLRLTHPGR